MTSSILPNWMLAAALWLPACGPTPPVAATVPAEPRSQPDATAEPESKTSASQHKMIGERLYAEGRFAESARHLVSAIEAGDRDPTTAYNAACAWALVGSDPQAFRYLELAIDLGFTDTAHATRDTDLEALHDDRRWSSALARMEAEREKAAVADAAEDARLASLAASASLPRLSAEQRTEDFDRLIELIEQVSPQLGIRAQVTGVDPRAELAAMRPLARDARTIEEFAALVNSALIACQDGHTSRVRYGYQTNTRLKRLGASDPGIALARKYDAIFDSRAQAKRLVLPIEYLGGEYYTVAEFRYRGKRFRSGLRLVTVDGEDVHEFVRGLYRHVRMMRWDSERHRYFSERFYRAGKFTAETTLTLTFANAKGERVKGDFRLGDALPKVSKRPSNPAAKRVELFEQAHLLYIRMPEMDVADTDWYPQKIREVAADNTIEKVVFDVRDNPGGGDGVWREALAAVIAEPIVYDTVAAFNDSEIVLGELAATDAPVFAAAFLGGAKFRAWTGRVSIEPSANSIAFGGTIYVLQNANIYSSAGALAAVATLADNIIRIGQPTGRLLGLGINPLVFELPHSKMLLRIEPVVDLTDANAAIDAYHDSVEVLVEPSVADHRRRTQHRGDVFSKTFLMTHDPVFKRILSDQRP